MRVCQRQCGMSMIGMVIVMIIVGALAAAVLPKLMSKNIQSTQGSDRLALEAAKAAVVGFALSNGRIPAAAGITAQCGNGTMPANTFGANNWGQYGKDNPFCMDVNGALTAPIPAGADPAKTLCSRVQTALATAATELPRICQDSNDHSAIPCANSAPVAFVLYSTGSDHAPNQENATAVNRIYESDSRGIDNSADDLTSPAPRHHYDDQLVSYPLSSLANACTKAGGGGASLPVCNLDASPSTIVPGCQSILTASCSSMSTNPQYNWSNPPGWATTMATSGVSPTVTTTYSVSGTNELGPGAPVSKTVTVTPAACTVTPSTANVVAPATQTFTASCTNSTGPYTWSAIGCTPTSTTANSALFTTSTSPPANCGKNGSPYTVTVSAPTTCGGTATGTATLTVVSNPVAPVCSISPLAATKTAGATSQIFVASCPTGTPPPTFGVWSGTGTAGGTTSTSGGIAGDTFTTASNLAASATAYGLSVTGTNASGSSIANATLTVSASTKTVQITNSSVANGNHTIYVSVGATTCAAAGVPTAIAKGVTSAVLGPYASTNLLWIYTNSNCNGTALISSAGTALSTLDTDGNNLVSCTGSDATVPPLPCQ